MSVFGEAGGWSGEAGWQAVGYEYVSEVNRIPEYDLIARKHLWIMTVVYSVDPEKVARPAEGDQAILDHETLIALLGPGCYYCLHPYVPWVPLSCSGVPGVRVEPERGAGSGSGAAAGDSAD